jgi:hypothetical protein
MAQAHYQLDSFAIVKASVSPSKISAVKLILPPTLIA